MANTYSLQQVWERKFEVSHYKKPLFRAFSVEKFTPGLEMGATFNRQFASDLAVNSMGANGSYSVQAFTNTNESGVVNIKDEASYQIVEWQKMQDHLKSQTKYAEKAANALWLQVDAEALFAMQQAAANYIDDAVLNPASGVAGAPITLGINNVMPIFTTSIQLFQLANVVYEPNKSLKSDVKLETISDALCAAVNPQLYTTLLQYIGGKTTVLGDTISRNGHAGLFMGHNLFAGNTLPWEGVYYGGTGNPSDGDTLTLLSGVTVKGVSQALTFTFKSALTSPAVAGEVIIGTALSDTIKNLAAAMNAPYTAIVATATAGFSPFIKTALTTAQIRLLRNLYAVQTASASLGAVTSASGTYLDLFVKGQGNIPVGNVAATNAAAWGYQCQHLLFATSQSVSLLMQKEVHVFENPVSGQVAHDFVFWDLYGVKVFTDQSYQIIDVKINSAAYGAAGSSPAVSF